MDTPIMRAEHEEFRRRMEEENRRQDRRIELLEKNVRELGVDTSRMEGKYGGDQPGPIPKEPQEDAYGDLLNDLVVLRSSGATTNEINGVLLSARRKGTITEEQLRQLRGAYVGSSR